MHKYFYNTKMLRISYSKNHKQKGVLELFSSEDRKVLAGLHVVVDWVSVISPPSPLLFAPVKSGCVYDKQTRKQNTFNLGWVYRSVGAKRIKIFLSLGLRIFPWRLSKSIHIHTNARVYNDAISSPSVVRVSAMSEFVASFTVSGGGRFHTGQYGDRTGEIQKEKKKTKPKVYRKYARAKAPVTVMLYVIIVILASVSELPSPHMGVNGFL